MKATKEDYKKVIKIFSSEIAKETCTQCFNETLEQRCCCNGCGENSGYLAQHYSHDAIQKIKEDFNFKPQNPTTRRGGFLTDKGCSLPRDIRSGTCQGYVCYHLGAMLKIRLSGSPDHIALGSVFGDRTKRTYKGL